MPLRTLTAALSEMDHIFPSSKLSQAVLLLPIQCALRRARFSLFPSYYRRATVFVVDLQQLITLNINVKFLLFLSIAQIVRVQQRCLRHATICISLIPHHRSHFL